MFKSVNSFQELALESFSHMTSFLEKDEELQENADPEKVIEVTSGLVKATGNLLEAIMAKKHAAQSGGNKTANSTRSENETRSERIKKVNLFSYLFQY